MRSKSRAYLKRVLIYICTAVLVLITGSCGMSMDDNQCTKDLPETGTENLKPTAFEMDIEYLRGKGLKLPELSSQSSLKVETFLSLLVETYESLGHKIYISKVNPRNKANDAVKKMSFIGAHDGYLIQNDMHISDLDYGSASYLLMKLQDSIQKRLYWRSDTAATTGDLLRRINVSTVLHTWTQNEHKGRIYTIGDLLKGEAGPDQRLTRLMAAEMMVSAYEDNCGEIQTTEASRPRDTNDVNAWKANQFFFWPESENFESDKTGNWEDWSFMSVAIYDSQLREGLKMEEKTPYGAVVAALVYLVRSYHGIEQNFIEEKIVLNERPYDWHVYQQESGEYSAVNCMPSCVEMAMRYQGILDVPSTEKLRKDNLLDGQGWNDVLAENVMRQYGLKFTDSFDIKLDKMLNLLDSGNILYVMYSDLSSELGHAVIIKGYWKLGSSVNFIVSDPNNNMFGPFGYPEYARDTQTMLSEIERHVPRYFIIPQKE